jgi:diguanylate cyclase (GGDEF)-like protein
MNAWSTQQLTEFLTAISAAGSRSAALRLAAERMAESVEAEVGAVISKHRVLVQVGFPPSAVPRTLARQLESGADPVALTGFGLCRTAIAPLDDAGSAALVVARAGESGFDAEDRALLRGMARILALSLRNIALFERERAARRTSQRHAADTRERQRLLEALGAVQRMIVDRAPQQTILDRLSEDVGRFVGDPVVGLRLADSDGYLHLASIVGLDDETVSELRRNPVKSGVGGMAMAADQVVVVSDYPNHASAIPILVEKGLQTAAAAPLRQDGRPIGSLVVASFTPGRKYSAIQLDALGAFAEHASMCLTDAARTSHMVHQALHDALTGLPNRTVFLDRLGQRLRPGRARRAPCAVLFIDIDNLKRVNDTLGHSAGDAVLIEVGKRLRNVVRAADAVARLSGDEFTVLLDTVDGDTEAMTTAQRLLTALRQPLTVNSRLLTLSASIGVRVAQAGRDRADDVLRGADLAMYEAKGRRDGLPGAYRPEMDVRAVRRLELESDLRAALDADEFRVLYQPMVDLRDGIIRAVEALVRWDRGPLGLVSPLEFIPLAEETGLIVDLGEWVLAEACKTVAALDRGSATPLELSVNLSGRQLTHDGLEATVARALVAAGLAPERLTLEITESVLLADGYAIVDRLSALRRMGVKVAIDDFGTGYSSLSYLRRLPIDAVKIDRTFIEHMTGDPRQAALVEAIIGLCRSLDLQVVAEGVESPDQARRLLELGCHLAQGYELGRPKPASALRALLRKQPARATKGPAEPVVRRHQIAADDWRGKDVSA